MGEFDRRKALYLVMKLAVVLVAFAAVLLFAMRGRWVVALGIFVAFVAGAAVRELAYLESYTP